MDPAGGPNSLAGEGADFASAALVPRPALAGRLGSARVTVVSAPAGSGKTVLLRSWLGQAGVTGRAAWVPARRGEQDPQRLWVAVVGALRRTGAGAGLVRAASAAPDLDAWGVVERLLADLAPLESRLWLVIDDVHELGPETLRQLELLVMRAPPQLRFVLAARHDVRLGLHRLRLEGELAEIRADDLRFTLDEAGQLLAAAGADLPGPALALLHERTEGWAAGLRLAALALTGHPDPARFAADFSGTDRTVADYLLAEVLDRQPAPVRRLLLRTSILERVNGDLARLLTGDDGADRILQDLEQAGSFTVSLDPGRTWFRYHQLFAGLLQLELRRAAPGEVTRLHLAAAGWLAAHGYPAEATRHAQAAADWPQAARLLAGHWPGLYLDGQAAAVHELVAAFPAHLLHADPALAAVAAADELAQGSLDAAERYLDLARRQAATIPGPARGQARLLLEVVALLLAGQRGNLPAAAEQARKLAATQDTNTPQPALTEDLRALALISLGRTLYWTARREEAGEHLERGVALARQIGRPYLEFTGLAYQAAAVLFHSYVRADAIGRQAVELARRHGWTDDPAFGVACGALGTLLAGQGRPDEAEPWIEEAERTLIAEAQPAQYLAIRYDRGVLEQARGRDAAALAAFEGVEPLARRLASSHLIIPRAQAQMVHSLVRLGQTERAARILAGLSGPDREHGEIRIATATLRLAQRDPGAALTELAPTLDGPAHVNLGFWQVMAYALEAAARNALGDEAAADKALERALDLAEPDGALTPFLLVPSLGLLERHAGHGTAHASLLAGIRGMLAGAELGPPTSRPAPLPGPLSGSELRVLRYLPTNLTAPEIARELYVSPNTVKTHTRNLYAKLGTHHRAGAVERARALGLLAPSRTAPPHHSS